jgi:hypothetical protein
MRTSGMRDGFGVSRIYEVEPSMVIAGMFSATDLAIAIGQIITPAATVVMLGLTNRIAVLDIIEDRASI